MTDSKTDFVPIAADLLEILVCPLTRSSLTQDGAFLVASRPFGAGLRYEINKGIPTMLVDAARLPEGVADLAMFKTRYATELPVAAV